VNAAPAPGCRKRKHRGLPSATLLPKNPEAANCRQRHANEPLSRRGDVPDGRVGGVFANAADDCESAAFVRPFHL